MQRNPYEAEARDKKVQALVHAARKSGVTAERVESFNPHQWKLLAGIASRMLNRNVEPPHSQATIAAVVAQMKVDERTAKRTLDDLIADYYRRESQRTAVR